MKSAITAAPEEVALRLRARVEGIVQGVGFRPFVYRLAREIGLGGFVRNDERGVLLEVEGDAAAIARFFARLPAEAPPLAGIERIVEEIVEARGEQGFSIVESARDGEPATLIAPDAATCDDCLREVFDPADRRFRYPFTNCTGCGPRFTIVRGVPYDRPLTTMAGFAMCPNCQAEYDDPLDRRFHAQPNACPACGPAVRLANAEGQPIPLAPGQDAIRAAAEALAHGKIVAIKGIGGYHLAARADDEAAVAALRARKHREDKPFALMARDLAAVRLLIETEPEDEALLASRARPIVLGRRVAGARAAEAVAPRTRDLGVLLPYSPLHHLLLSDLLAPEDGSEAVAAIVLTSGNVSDEPIAYRDEDALARLHGIADLFLLHDRPIQTRTDDSVVRTVALAAPAEKTAARRTQTLRRSRGEVPKGIDLPLAASRPLLACGAELKSTFCLAKGRRAWVGPHVGDLENYETLVSFREGIEHFERLFAVTPEVIAHDLHPNYLSTAYARERPDVLRLGIQHHHAHLAACLAEHGEEGQAIGAIYDGTGYGLDGTVWGGELLLGGLAGFERLGHLWPVRLPGGEQAIRQPWRMACAWLLEASGRPETPPEIPAALRGAVEPRRWRAVADLARSGFSAPLTTSIGRLFDAVAALCGLRPEVSFEGQAAVELEALGDLAERGSYPLPLVESKSAEENPGPLLLDARETVLAVARDAEAGTEAPTIGARFHNALARATAEATCRLAEAQGVRTIVLSGGVFQNRLLLERTAARLIDAGLRVLTPEKLPPNDGGISYGQAAVAAAQLAENIGSRAGNGG